jgi:hypothetical protein
MYFGSPTQVLRQKVPIEELFFGMGLQGQRV